jgi:hypothetical protein
LLRIFFAMAASVAASGCVPTKQIETIVKTVDRQIEPMPAVCREGGGEPFRTVTKTGGDKTPVAALGQALEINKVRMHANSQERQACACWISSATRNAADMQRLDSQCKAQPKAAGHRGS